MVTKYHVRNLDCVECCRKIEDHLRSVEGIRNVSMSFATMTLLVDTDTPEIIRGEITRIEPGVQIVPLSQSDLYPEEDAGFKPASELIILSIAAVLFLVELLFEAAFRRHALWYVEYPLVLAAYLLAGWNVVWNAFRSLRTGGFFDENVLMTLATAGALSIHVFAEAIGVMIFYKAGELLQNFAVERSRHSIRSLLSIRPHFARVVRNGVPAECPPDEVSVGEEILVRPGERVPLDGEVVAGTSRIDTSALTGESVPVTARAGSTVLAGEINLQGLLKVRVLRPFALSSIARVLELVENASGRKAKTERFVSRISRYYTPFVVGAAVILAVIPPLAFQPHDFHAWLYRALVLLVISCPCALVISIPLGFFGGIGGASRQGVLVKGAQYLELLSRVKTVIFDKTGTLTQGIFKVLSVVPAGGFTADEILSYAAAAEHNSNHPIALSIREEAAKSGLGTGIRTIEIHKERHGYGVHAELDGRRVIAGTRLHLAEHDIVVAEPPEKGTVVHVGVDNLYGGYIVIGDRLKADSAAAIKTLHAMGIHEIYLLTGDSAHAAEAVREELGIDKVWSELLPHHKVEIFEELLAQKHHDGAVAFVGDGVNDAPVLARADVGIAMGTLGSEAAIDTADVVISGDSPLRVVDAIRVGRATQAIVWQNIIFALLVKFVFISLGAMGLATMWAAVFADMGTAVLAVFNSTRTLRAR